MQEFLTWTMLGTYAGAVLATTLITQFIKELGFLASVPTRATSYVVALIILIAATLFSGVWAWADLALCVLNAVVVSLAANGGYEMLSNK